MRPFKHLELTCWAIEIRTDVFYKIRNDALFRRYEGFGYITDNSDYSYRPLVPGRPYFGDKFVNESAAVMLSALSKTPRSIESIMLDLKQEFEGVDAAELQADAETLFQAFADQGYLSFGTTAENCTQHERDWPNKTDVSSESSSFDGFATQHGTNVESTHTDLSNDSSAHDDGVLEIADNKNALRSLHIDLTNACNERCVHCYIPHSCRQMLSSELFYRIIEEGRHMNMVHVTLSGGEPLLHKEFIPFLARCRELDLAVNVLSNLLLLTDEMIEEMRRNPLLSVQTSLYAIEPRIHDAITGREGSCEKTKNAILKLREAGVAVQISCPAMKQNKDCVGDVIDWGAKLNIAVGVEPSIFASYDHSGCNLVHRLSLEELGDVIDQQLLAGQASTLYENAKSRAELTAESPVCSVCKNSVCVSASGEVFPCAGWQTNILGDLNKQSLRDIWENSSKAQQLRAVKRKHFSKCLACENRCYCTICMMRNANENQDGDAFKINAFQCRIAALTRQKVESYANSHNLVDDID